MKIRTLILPIVAVGLTTASCDGFLHKELKPTMVGVKDSVRHYYPVVLGDELSITCQIANNGQEPLAITDIQPSNFSIRLTSPMPQIIPPGGIEYLNFVFNTEKNVGYAQHEIRFFGNILPDGVAMLTFDTHIVRPTVDEFDYEEVYFHHRRDMLDELVDGDQGQKGYWVDGSDEDSAYQHSYKKYLIW